VEDGAKRRCSVGLGVLDLSPNRSNPRRRLVGSTSMVGRAARHIFRRHCAHDDVGGTGRAKGITAVPAGSDIVVGAAPRQTWPRQRGAGGREGYGVSLALTPSVSWKTSSIMGSTNAGGGLRDKEATSCSGIGGGIGEAMTGASSRAVAAVPPCPEPSSRPRNRRVAGGGMIG